MADEEKSYTVKIHAEASGSDGKAMFTSEVVYENMHYQDVVMVEGALIGVLDSLQKFAKDRPDKQKPKKVK